MIYLDCLEYTHMFALVIDRGSVMGVKKGGCGIAVTFNQSSMANIATSFLSPK